MTSPVTAGPSSPSLVSPLVSTVELRSLLEAVTVLDVRWRMGGPPGRVEHAAGHVPGATYVDLDADLAGPAGEGGRHPLPAREAFEVAMRRCGVRSDRPVVVVDDWSGRAAARAWWLLRHHGHPDVRVLDGGWSAWLADGGPVEQGEGEPVAGDFVASEGRLAVVSADGARDVGVLLDAREPERFRGDVEPVDPVAGHVPGALNAPTSANLRPDGRFEDVEVLRSRYAAAGATPGADVATYCGSGVTATHDLLALAVVGVDAALYPGSWSEWVRDPSRPVARN